MFFGVGLHIWGILMLFVYQFTKGFKTILLVVPALVSSTVSQALLKPKEPPKDEIRREGLIL